MKFSDLILCMTREELRSFLLDNSFPQQTVNTLFEAHVTGKMFCEFDKEHFLLLDLPKGPILSLMLLKDKLECMNFDFENKLKFCV